MYEDDMDFDEEFDEGLYNAIRKIEEESLKRGIVSITNIDKKQLANGIYEVLKKLLAKRTDVKVFMEPDDPSVPRYTYIHVDGKNIVFYKTKWFAEAIRVADYFEIYAKTNGTIRLSIGVRTNEVHTLNGGGKE